MKRYVLALAGATMVIGGAMAAADRMQFMTVKPDAMLSSKVSGLKVYNNVKENIADVADLVIEKNTLSGYVLSVGGFLGVGERYVAVPASSLQIAYDAGAKKWTATANVTKEQLKSAPEFKYDGKWTMTID